MRPTKRLPARETWNREAIQERLSTQYVGRHVHYFESIDSTNRVATELGRQGAAEGTLVIADRQTAGRGRLNRQWLAPAGSSLLMSLLFRPDLSPPQSMRVAMTCSLAIADAIEQTTPLHVRLKWPNDILVNGRKVGGILTELSLNRERLDFVVVGIGLNVNLSFEESLPTCTPEAAPDTSRASLHHLSFSSTSLSRELGREISRLALLKAFLESTERRYSALKAGHFPLREWAERLDTLHKEITVTSEGETLTGHAETVDEDGALLLRLNDGSLKRILAGDVTLRTLKET